MTRADQRMRNQPSPTLPTTRRVSEAFSIELSVKAKTRSRGDSQVVYLVSSFRKAWNTPGFIHIGIVQENVRDAPAYSKRQNPAKFHLLI